MLVEEVITKERNWLDGTTWEYGGLGFWSTHVAAVALIGWLSWKLTR